MTIHPATTRTTPPPALLPARPSAAQQPTTPPLKHPTNRPPNQSTHQSTNLPISQSTTPLISVVIPTHGRPHLLDRCLAALIAQDLDPDSYEIIVAGDGDHDPDHGQATRQVVARYVASSHSPRVHYLPLSHHAGPAAARNAGWRAAHGPIIAFTDDDCVPDPGWLRAGLAAFQAPPPGDRSTPTGVAQASRLARGTTQRVVVHGPVVGVTGRLVMPLPDGPSDYARDAARLARSDFVTANCFYRRDVLQAVGGFDERFGWREDSDLFFRVWKHTRAQQPRGLLVRAPQAVVVHPIRPAPWGVSLGQQRKSRYNALLYKQHPRLYRDYLGLSTPWHYYGIVAAATTGLVSLATGHRRAAGAAAGVWAALTGRFLARRLSGAALNPSHVLEMGITSLLIPWLAIYWRLRGALEHRVFFL